MINLDLNVKEMSETEQDMFREWLNHPFTRHILAGLQTTSEVVVDDLVEGRVNSEAWQIYYSQGYVKGLKQLANAIQQAQEDLKERKITEL